MIAPIKNNPFDADTHIFHFAEFVKAVQDAGGTTPHMLMIVESANREIYDFEKLWWAGCYMFVYNYPSAEVIYNYCDVGCLSHTDLVKWIADNWKGIKFRKERKAARSAERLACCIETYFDYMFKIEHKEWFLSDTLSNNDRYIMAFDDFCSNVKYAGRYIAIRWIEVIRRVFNIQMEMPDIQPKDGEHPRKALALMYPEYEQILMGGNSQKELDTVNYIADMCLEDINTLYDVKTDYYTLQSLLCEYKQSCLGRKQYPGKSIDTEMAYFCKIKDYWAGNELDSIMFNVRKTIFPKYCLGEINGWNGVREELCNVLVDYGYTWSDIVYDYTATKDFAHPVLRNKHIKSIL